MGDLLTDTQRREIIKKLREEREKKGMTQEEVAKKAGMHTNSLAKVERGVSKAAPDTLLKIAKALGMKSSDILPF